jgi:hypothetical protein
MRLLCFAIVNAYRKAAAAAGDVADVRAASLDERFMLISFSNGELTRGKKKCELVLVHDTLFGAMLHNEVRMGRRTFSREFEFEAVELVKERGVTQAAADLHFPECHGSLRARGERRSEAGHSGPRADGAGRVAAATLGYHR